MKIFYGETVYLRAPTPSHVLSPCRYRAHAPLRGWGLCRDLEAHKRYEERI